MLLFIAITLMVIMTVKKFQLLSQEECLLTKTWGMLGEIWKTGFPFLFCSLH